jgi:hypothetical protein
MNWDFKPDNYLGSAIGRQVTTPIKVKRMSYEDSELNYFPEEGLCKAFINKDFLHALNLYNPLVEVYPIHPEDRDLPPISSFQRRRMLRFKQERLLHWMQQIRCRPTEPATFLLQETSKLIIAPDYNFFTSERGVTECIEAPNGWFEEEMIPDCTDVVEVILKSVLYPNFKLIKRYINSSK